MARPAAGQSITARLDGVNDPTSLSDQEIQATAIIVVAAGSGTRLGYGMPKALVPLAGRTLLEHALDRIARSAACAGSGHRRAPPEDDRELAALRGTPSSCTRGASTGGATRNDSVRAGLAALAPGIERVLIHDAARALTPPEVFRQVAAALAAGARAVIPALPVVDTIKHGRRRSGQAASRTVTGTPAPEHAARGADPAGLPRAHAAAPPTQRAAGWDTGRGRGRHRRRHAHGNAGRARGHRAGRRGGPEDHHPTGPVLAESMLAPRTGRTPR